MAWLALEDLSEMIVGYIHTVKGHHALAVISEVSGTVPPFVHLVRISG